MYRNARKAFTLIELLVVIAIIAILAAILFPVFAQARVAARGASSISNLKQITLGVLMYEQDYDSQYPMFQSWENDGQVSWGGPPYWTQWTFTIAPYLKNAQVYADPLFGSPNFTTNLNAGYAWNISVTPDYGYNYNTLSPGFYSQTYPVVFAGTQESLITAPADTVMFTGRFDQSEANNDTCWFGLGYMANIGNAEAPDCEDYFNSGKLCWTDWATNGNNTCMPLSSTLVAGYYTGGNSVRKNGNMNFSFVDGHAKFVTPGAGAQGSSWHQGSLSGTIHVTNPSTYMWQVIP